MTIRIPTILFILIVALFAFCLSVAGQKTRFKERMPDELISQIDSRLKAINDESAKFSKDEWVGHYSSYDATTVSTTLVWTPNLGFMIWLENCSRPFHGLVNYGKASFSNHSLKLIPELPKGSFNEYPVESEFIPVKWGEQHFLIPTHKMIDFLYAVNSKSDSEIQSFLSKRVDDKKPRKGLPDVPKEYRSYLRLKPIAALISAVEKDENYDLYSVTLNAGRAEGVIDGMAFYLSRSKDAYIKIYIQKVQEHSSEGFVAFSTFKGNREGNVEPKIGWKFTSRAPKDNSRYDFP
jgi:hypothetical protein